MELIQYTKESGGRETADSILALEDTAWPREPGEGDFPSAPETYDTSFVLMEGGMAVCHVGVRKSRLYHMGQEYLAYGLSEVVTRPGLQGQGLASRLIREAAGYITAGPADLSIFTCARERVPLYARGGWEPAPRACLVGGTAKEPFRSDSLGLVTMIRLISPKAMEHRKDFEGTDICLELGAGQLW